AYAELKGVMVRGLCEIIEDPAEVTLVFAWMAEDRGEVRSPGASRSAPKRVALKIVPTKTVTWDHSKLGGRYCPRLNRRTLQRDVGPLPGGGEILPRRRCLGAAVLRCQ